MAVIKSLTKWKRWNMMLRIFLAVPLLAVMSSTEAEAGGCRVRSVARVPVAAVVTPVIPVIPVTPVIVNVPTYSYSYAPPAQQAYQAETATGDCCQQLVAELAKLRGEFAALRGGSVEGRMPSNGAALLQARCGKCHSGAEPKGEMALFGADGKASPLSLDWKKRIARRVNAGTMPPKTESPLTEAEKITLLDTLK